MRGVDVDGVFYATKAVWPHLVGRGRGASSNIASVQGLVGSAFKVAYCAAKHGVIGLTNVTAIEGATIGITVNATCPGDVMTELIRGQGADLVTSFGGGITEEEALHRTGRGRGVLRVRRSPSTADGRRAELVRQYSRVPVLPNNERHATFAGHFDACSPVRSSEKGASMSSIVRNFQLMSTVGREWAMVSFYAERHAR